MNNAHACTIRTITGAHLVSLDFAKPLVVI